MADKSIELSKLAVSSRLNNVGYRIFMFLCPVLFAITGLLYVAPRLHDVVAIVLWMISVGGCIIAGIFMSQGGWRSILHNIGAYAMGIAMLGLAVRLAIVSPGLNKALWAISFIMVLLAFVGKVLQRKYYVIYEIGFIFLSHISMILVTVAL